MDRILDQENFSEAERELLRIPGDSRYGDEGPEPQRHSMFVESTVYMLFNPLSVM